MLQGERQRHHRAISANRQHQTGGSDTDRRRGSAGDAAGTARLGTSIWMVRGVAGTTQSGMRPHTMLRQADVVAS